MSTLTIRKTWSVNGVLTNPTSIVLCDPTGTYGIQRDDTGATVVPAGATMTPIATGVFEYTLAVDGGTTYTVWVQVAYNGQTYNFEITAVPEPASVSTVYPDSLADVLAQLAALLLQITLKPKPSYAVHGHNYSWAEYQEMLTRQMEQITKLIAQANPFEIVSRG
jgi:Rad3-related DNA helicase